MDGILDWRWLSPALLATLREEVEEQYAEDLYLARLRRGSAAGKLPPFSATYEGVAPGTVQGLGTLPLPPGIVVPPDANYSEVMDTVIEAPSHTYVTQYGIICTSERLHCSSNMWPQRAR